MAREIEVNPSKKEEAGEVEDLQKDLMRRSAQLDQMQEVLLKLKLHNEYVLHTFKPVYIYTFVLEPGHSLCSLV